MRYVARDKAGNEQTCTFIITVDGVCHVLKYVRFIE